MADSICYECEYYISNHRGDIYCRHDVDITVALALAGGAIKSIPKLIPRESECGDFRRKKKNSRKTKSKGTK